MVIIQKLAKAKCQMSGKKAEGVHCKFQNGMFEGFLSWQSLRQMDRLISTRPKSETQQSD